MPCHIQKQVCRSDYRNGTRRLANETKLLLEATVWFCILLLFCIILDSTRKMRGGASNA
ncbi:hypothetical protein ACHAWT_007632, partial [Skeletonema menzelii]